MRKVLFVVIPLVLASPLGGAEIFKCTKGGETVYQNFQCSVESIGSHATAPKPPDAPLLAAAEGSAARLGDTSDIHPQRAAAEAMWGKLVDGKYEPRVGMSKGQVRILSWGEPADIQRAESGEGHIEIWTYPDKRKLVFDPNGRLASVQDP